MAIVSFDTDEGAAKPRYVPSSFSYPAPLVDLVNDELDWQLGPDSGQTGRGPPLSLELVLEKIALLRSFDMRRGEIVRLELKAETTRKYVDRNPDWENPLREQPECEVACQRLQNALRQQEGVLIYGDFDCDGMTAVTLMYEALRAFGFRSSQVSFVIPDRLRDGYGLKSEVIEEHLRSLRKWQKPPSVLIVVDCGTTSQTEVTKLLARPIDVIVVDHHVPDQKHPLRQNERLIHINPKLWVDRNGWNRQLSIENMCAAGLVYLLAEVLLESAPDYQDRWSSHRAVLLAGFATVVDVMKLTGINRILVKRSLAIANDEKKLKRSPGLFALKQNLGPFEKSGQSITEQTYGFYWGPCINASGRMTKAHDSLRLLLARNSRFARKQALVCVKANRWRRATQLAMTEEAMNTVGYQSEEELPPIIVVSRPWWHPGVVGLVASRLAETFRRPTIAATLTPQPTKEDPMNTIWRGSGRSVEGGCDLGALFHEAASADPPLIKQGGGHPMAGGLSFTDAQRSQLQRRLSKLVKKVENRSIEFFASASTFEPKQWRWIFRQCAPFGNGNPCPALIVEAAELLGVRVRTRLTERRESKKSDGEEAELDSTSGQRLQARTDYWAVVASDIREVASLVERLREGVDEVSVFLRNQMDPPCRELLESFSDVKRDGERMAIALASSMNRIIKSPGLYDAQRFEYIRLRPATKTILRLNPTGPSLVQLNRMLIEDAFPAELVQQRMQGMPQLFAYEGVFEDKITGRPFIAQWIDLETAEMLWQPHRFRTEQDDNAPPFRLPNLFRLQLELRQAISARERSNVYQGKAFQRDAFFQVRQCIPIRRGPMTSLRMKVKKHTSSIVGAARCGPGG